MKSKTCAAVVALAGGMAALTLAASPASAQSRRERAPVERSSSSPSRSSSPSSRNVSSSTERRAPLSMDRRTSSSPERRTSLPSSLPSSLGRQSERRNDSSVNTLPRPNTGSLNNPGLYSFERLRDQRAGDIMQNRGSLPSSLPRSNYPSAGLPPKSAGSDLPSRLPRDRYRGNYNGGYYDRDYDRNRYHRGRDTVIILGGGSTFFGGYVSTYQPGLSFYSPFRIYNCPTYIHREYLVTTPYPYLSGRETYTVLPYSDNDRYYRSNVHRGQALRAALNDLIRFWEDEDGRALRNHISPDLSIGVFQDEKYAFSLRRADFLDLSADAQDRVTTLSFRFDSVRERSDGLVNAQATHLYRVRGERESRSAAVRYTLIYVDGTWYVSAISHAADIAR